MGRGGAHPGVVHAGKSRRQEAGVGHVAIQGGRVDRVKAPVLVLISQHAQPLPLLQVAHPLVLTPGVHCHQRVLAVVVVGLPVPVGALRIVEARRRQPLQRVAPQQEVSGQWVSPVDVQPSVGVSQGIPHGVPVERRIWKALTPWYWANPHKGSHHPCPVQRVDAVHGMYSAHGHGHWHGGHRGAGMDTGQRDGLGVFRESLCLNHL